MQIDLKLLQHNAHNIMNIIVLRRISVQILFRVNVDTLAVVYIYMYIFFSNIKLAIFTYILSIAIVSRYNINETWTSTSVWLSFQSASVLFLWQNLKDSYARMKNLRHVKRHILLSSVCPLESELRWKAFCWVIRFGWNIFVWRIDVHGYYG